MGGRCLRCYLTDVISSESVLIESKRLGIISESTYRNIIALQTDEIRQFRSKTEVSERHLNNEVVVACSTLNGKLYLGKIGYFVNRYLVTWEPRRKISCNPHVLDQAESDWNLGGDGQHYSCRSCAVGQDEVAKVRHMTDGDWMYLAELSKCQNVGNPLQLEVSYTEVGPATWMIKGCLNCARLSAQRALLSLKSIPVAARRGLPVLVNSQGLLLSIPSIGFEHYPCLMSSVLFKPRIPLGGGYSSFI